MNRARVAAALLIAVVGCNFHERHRVLLEHDRDALMSAWTERIAQQRARVGELRAREAALPAGIAARDALAAERAACEGDLAKLVAELDAAGRAWDEPHRKRDEVQMRAVLDIGERKLEAAAAALGATTYRFDRDLAAASERVTYDTPPPPPPPPPPTPPRAPTVEIPASELADPGFARRVRTFELAELVFEPGSSTLVTADPVTSTRLAELVSMASSCPGLRFELVGHTSREGNADVNRKLSEARAALVRDYLVARGVDPRKITRMTGVGGDVPRVAEPAPDADETKAMAPAALEALRAQNRRITIAITTPCP